MLKKCFFWGASNHAKVLNEFIGDFGYKLYWLFDNDPKVTSVIENIPIVGGWDNFIKWAKNNNSKKIDFLVAIGGENQGRNRLKLQDEIISLGFNVLTVWHKTSYIAKGVAIDKGSQILANVIICVDTHVGKACIVNTGAQIDHDCFIDDGVHIMPGAILTGCVKVNKFATIGSGAIVLPKITIGEGAVIGAGAVVTKDVDPYMVMVGMPAKAMKRRI